MRTASTVWQSENPDGANYQSPDWTPGITQAQEAAEIAEAIDQFGPCPVCDLTGRECAELPDGKPCCGAQCRHTWQRQPGWWR